MDAIEFMKKEMLRRRFSLKTIKSYMFCVKKFLVFYQRELHKVNKYDIIDYLNKLTERNYSGSTININLQALKFLMEEVLHKKKTFYYIKYSKTSRKLPEVLTKEETIRFLRAITNKKHLLLIKLMYSAGFRVSELVHLKARDLELEKNYGWVRRGKGDRDRLFIVAQTIKEELHKHIEEKKICLDSWVFEGRKGHHLSQKSVYMIVKKAAMSAKIHKRIHPHTLRHSFSTHLVENGYDVTSVQSLLGHKSPETTMIYLHMASPNMINVISPLDSLEIEK